MAARSDLCPASTCTYLSVSTLESTRDSLLVESLVVAGPWDDVIITS